MKIGIVDTTFARVNMGGIAIDELKKTHPEIEYERRTVPGIKDIPVECKILLEKCDICIALGMVGGAPIDTQCGHEASISIQQVKLMTNKHIIEVFVHENEGWNEDELKEIFENRIRKHVRNTALMITNPQELEKFAGRGVRQGKEDEGSLETEKQTMIGIVVSDFNDELTERMEEKAIEIANEEKISAKIIHVPGIYDMPLVVKKLLMDKKIDAVVTLGAVVKGETSHDEIITKDVAKRLGELSLEFKKPVTLGIIGHNAEYDVVEERVDDYAERATKAAIYLIKILREDIAKQEVENDN